MLKHIVVYLYCLWICIYYPFKICAQGDSSFTQDAVLETVTIYGSAFNLKNNPNVTSINQQKIMATNTFKDVPSILDAVPSAVITSDAGTGIGYTSIRFRGLDPSQIKVMINGVPYNDAESHSVYWVDIPDISSSLQDILIHRGTTNTSSGAGDFGVHMNLNTFEKIDSPRSEIQFGFGSFGTNALNIKCAVPKLFKMFDVTGRISNIYSNGYIDRSRSNLKSQHLAVHWLRNSSSFRLQFFNGKEITQQAWNGLRDLDAAFIKSRTYNSAGTEKTGAPYENEIDHYKQYQIQAFFNTRLNHNWSANAIAYITKGAGFFENYKSQQLLRAFEFNIDTTSDIVRQKHLDNTLMGTHFRLSYALANRQTFVAGISYSNYDGGHFGKVIWNAIGLHARQNYYTNNGIKQDANVSLQYFKETDNRKWSVNLNVRKLHYSIQGSEEDNVQINLLKKHVLLSPKMSLQQKWSKNILSNHSIAWSNKEPTRNDYLSVDDPNLVKVEQVLDIENGFTYKTNRITAQCNAYVMLFNNQLLHTGVLNIVGDPNKINVQRSYRIGLETSLHWKITNYVSCNASYTLSENKLFGLVEHVPTYDALTGEFTNHLLDIGRSEIGFSPKHIGHIEIPLGFQWAADWPFRLIYTHKFVSSQYLDNSSNSFATLNAYQYANLIFSQTLPFFNRQLQCKIGVYNIWNSTYANNGWNYRYRLISDSNSNLEKDNNGNLNIRATYPQAPIHLMSTISLQF